MTDTRTHERVRAHYEIEIELADRLRRSPPEVRRTLYGPVYEELFERVPDHPQLTRRVDTDEQEEYARRQVALVRALLPDGGSYVEIGAGDCATASRVARFAGSVTAVEVSERIVPNPPPAGVTVAISDGVSVPVPAQSADLVYSNQLMEHLHPDDAIEQLRNIAATLRHGGRYVCITPNRITGPHDISKGFDRTTQGFHLREYTYGELKGLLLGAGFRRVRVLERAGGRTFDRVARLAARVAPAWARRLEAAADRPLTLPLAPFLTLERLAGIYPGAPAERRLFRRLLGIHIVAER